MDKLAPSHIDSKILNDIVVGVTFVMPAVWRGDWWVCSTLYADGQKRTFTVLEVLWVLTPHRDEISLGRHLSTDKGIVHLYVIDVPWVTMVGTR